MAATLADVTYWARHHAETGDLISASVARTIAEYWTGGSENGALAAFASGSYVAMDDLLEDIDAAIRHAHTAQHDATIHEVYALKAWALHVAHSYT